MRTYLYRHFDADGGLLYVGVSLNALNRLGQHKDHSHWFDSICRVEIQKFDTRAKALAAETLAIGNERPKHNKHKRFVPEKLTVPQAEASRKELTGWVVEFRLIYTHQEAAAVLNIGTSAVRKLIQEKKLGSIILPPRSDANTAHGTPHKPKEVISGWQLIDYFETLHDHSKNRL